MTLILKTKNTINNPKAPYLLQYDPIESRTGSIFLWDAGLTPITSLSKNTVIPNSIPNYAESIGSSLIISDGGGVSLEQVVKTELTSKGGLHFIAAQSLAEDLNMVNTWKALIANDTLKQKLSAPFLNGNPNLYVSVWLTTTRHVTKDPSLGPILTYVNGNTTNTGFYIGTGHTGIGMAGSSPQPTTSKLGKNFKTATIVGQPNYYVGNIKQLGGTGITANTSMYLGTGPVPPFSGTPSGNQAWNGCPSFIVYRYYIEDLSKSGRTYEQVKAIDEAEHAKAFAEGGRFYGDSWSDPATVLG